MRSVAPHSAGKAASQKSWLVLYLKPTTGRLTTTTLHTIHTAKASVSAGIDSHRLRCATPWPLRSHEVLSSGFQLEMT